MGAVGWAVVVVAAGGSCCIVAVVVDVGLAVGNSFAEVVGRRVRRSPEEVESGVVVIGGLDLFGFAGERWGLVVEERMNARIVVRGVGLHCQCFEVAEEGMLMSVAVDQRENQLMVDVGYKENRQVAEAKLLL